MDLKKYWQESSSRNVMITNPASWVADHNIKILLLQCDSIKFSIVDDILSVLTEHQYHRFTKLLHNAQIVPEQGFIDIRIKVRLIPIFNKCSFGYSQIFLELVSFVTVYEENKSQAHLLYLDKDVLLKSDAELPKIQVPFLSIIFSISEKIVLFFLNFIFMVQNTNVAFL